MLTEWYFANVCPPLYKFKVCYWALKNTYDQENYYTKFKGMGGPE